MIQVLRDQRMHQQGDRRDALVDDVRRHWCLDQRLAATADPLAADMTLYRKHSWAVIELLADILADTLQTAAAAALGTLWLVRDVPPWEGCRQGYAPRLGLRRRRLSFPKRFELEADGLDIGVDALIQERALYDIELFATPAVLPALERRHLVCEYSARSWMRASTPI